MNKAPAYLFKVPNIGNLLNNDDIGDEAISHCGKDFPSNVPSDIARPNSRPPLQHTVSKRDSAATGSLSRPSSAVSGGRSLPASARSLFSVDYTFQDSQASVTTADDLISAIKGVEKGNKYDDADKKVKQGPNKKFIITIVLVVLAVVILASVLGSALPTMLSEKSQDKEQNTAAPATASTSAQMAMSTTLSSSTISTTENSTTTSSTTTTTSSATTSQTTTTTTTTTSTPTTTTPSIETPTSTRGTSSTPSPYPVLVIDENTNSVTYGGTWQEWTTWSECSRSCNAGAQSRNRICESEDLLCLGASNQHMRCNTALCPISEPVALWSTWNSWEECSTSCGTGAQIRRRLCTELETSRPVSNENCVGTEQYTRSCNTFACPVCSITCTTGTLDQTCTYCNCGQTITGLIMSDSHLPLDNVTITPTNAPYNTLATSTPGGFFAINNICVGETFSFHKHGYVTFTGTLMSAFENISMRHRVPLQVFQNPRDKMAVTGDSLTFCCGVHGIPEPDYYEWMKNGEVLPNSFHRTSSILELEGVTPDDTGYYQCRANNEYGAIYSASATLMVEGEYSAFCSPIPSSNIITLPEGCTINNESTIDKCKCEGNLCYSENGNGCDSEYRYYCNPSGLQRVISDCGDYTFPVFLVTSCACQLWQEDDLTIYGFAGSRDGQPLQNGEIYWNRSIISNTNNDGTFSFKVSRGTDRSSLLFIDVYNRAFMDTTYIFYFPSDSESSLYLRVNLMFVSTTYSLNASEPSTILMNATTITIPALSFYTHSGMMYTGTVIASICVIDPSNIDDVISAPGDLTIVDEEGDIQQLLSYAMFAMSFEDEQGNRLSIPGEITLSIQIPTVEGQDNAASNIRFWTLNPSTGVWEYASDLVAEEDTPRAKRQINRGQQTLIATLRGISIVTKWLNFDAISSQTCVVNVRLYKSDHYNAPQQIHNGEVYIVTEDSNGYNSLSRNRVLTDTGNNGYCMVSPCKSHRWPSSPMFHGYIFADSAGLQLIPETSPQSLSRSPLNLTGLLNYFIATENKIHVNFDENVVHNEGKGPFYDYDWKWQYSSRCSNADSTSNFFRFNSQDGCLVETNYWDTQGINIINEHNLLLWHDITSYYEYNASVSPDLRGMWAFKTCYIKIKAPQGLNVTAFSLVGDPRHRFITSSYGDRKGCVADEAVCLEVRPPQRPRIAPYNATYSVDDETQTKIRIKVDGTHGSQNFLQNVNINLIPLANSGSTFEMFLQSGNNYGSNHGIYCKTGNTSAEARQALSMCRHGSDSTTTQRQHTSSENWAVEFVYLNPAVGVVLGYTSVGILYVYHNNQWGTVCDDVFGSNNNGCNVVCRQLGYQSGVFEMFGAGSGPILLDDVYCRGTELTLNDCLHAPYGQNNCIHHEDAGCRCS